MHDALRRLWLLALEGDDTIPGDGGNDTGGNGDDNTPKFTQKQLNDILAKEKGKFKKETERRIAELEELKGKLGSDEDKATLQSQIDNLNDSLKTEKQLAEERYGKLDKKYKEDTEALTKKSNQWQERYTNSTIERDILDAASKEEAFSGNQIVAILRPHTRLVEKLNEDGKPTGDLIPKVKFQDFDKDGKPVELDLTVSEAVARMKKRDDYLNLFKSGASGGIGGRPSEGKGKDPAKMSPAEYREWRKTNMK